jgi:hypothetical protein
MIGKQVKVLWPVDGRWYQGTVCEYEASTKQHRLRYEDGDTELVKLGLASSGAKAERGDGRSNPKEQKNIKSATSNIQVPKEEGVLRSPVPIGYPTRGSKYYPEGQYPPYHGIPIFDQTAGHYIMPPYQVPFPGNRTSPDRKDGSSDGGSPPKRGPTKTWSKQEDADLLRLVQISETPVKWSRIASSMHGRNGKQCRERYVNHLNPRLKNSDWTSIEDATIFHLYNTMGSQWSNMSKLIPGRTDNGIKNRFHNLRRQHEREDHQRKRLSKASDFEQQIHLDRLRVLPIHLRGKVDELWDMNDSIGILAAQSVIGGISARSGTRFGPFRHANSEGEQCARCGLFAPSIHCGTKICTKYGWCVPCTRLPSHLCSNLLRECLSLRKQISIGENA